MSEPVMNFTAEATWGPDQPLSVLADLIEKRMKILGETVQSASIATGIEVLKSLRARTKTAPKNQRPAERRFERDYSKAPYLTKAGRLLRRWKYTSLPGTSGERTVVKYPYTTRHRVWDIKKKRGVMVGGSDKDEQLEILQNFGKHPIEHRGLAKTALGIAMHSLSASASPAASPSVSSLASANVSTHFSINGNTFELAVHDALKYAELAIKGGKAAVDEAYRAAANKVAGRLQHVINQAGGDFWGNFDIGTPFPEVKKRRPA